ncbi:MAG: phage portal protein [Candidatus Hodarchaeales archaeon]
MSFIDKVFKKFGYQKITWSQLEEREETGSNQGLSAIAPAWGSIPPKLREEDYLKAAESWVYVCVSAIADEIATINFRLYKRVKKGNKTEVQEVNSHPILDSLYRINNFTTKFDHIWLSQTYLELTGEAPWLLDKRGKFFDIYLLRPDRLEIKWDKEKVIGGYIYRLEDGKEISFKPEQIIMLKYPHPLKPFRGRGTLEAAARTYDLDKYSEQWNVQFFYNSARPDAILRTDKRLTKEQINRLKKEWNKMYRGVEKHAKTAILHDGLDYKAVQLSAKDMEFLAQQRFGRDKILSIFRVPKPIVAITEEVNRANAEVAAYSFARWTIKPKMQKLVEQLNEFFVPRFPNSENLFLDFDDPVPENSELKLKVYENALRNGWMTINEVRKAERLEPLKEGGDSIYLPINYIPIGGTKSMKEKIAPRYSRKLVSLDARNAERKEIEDIDETIRKVVKAHLKHHKNHKKKDINKKAIKKRQGIKDKKLFWEGQIKLAEREEERFISRLKTIFREQEKETLKRLRKEQRQCLAVVNKMAQVDSASRPKKYWHEMKLSIPRVLLDVKEENKRFVVSLTSLIQDIIETEGNYTLVNMGEYGQFNTTTEEVIKFLQEQPIKFANSVNKRTNKEIRRVLKEGIAEGESITKLTKRIEDVFKRAKGIRAQQIARTETSRATNFATLEAYKQSGVVKAKEWLTAFDERTCERCAAMNGKIVGLEEKYFKKGDSFMGIKFDYEDVGQPPLHVACRCTIIPVLLE